MREDSLKRNGTLVDAKTGMFALLVFAGCFVGARAGTMIVLPGVGAALLFPPYAVVCAALILSRGRHWWLYLMASSLGNFWPHLQHEGITSFVLEAEAANVVRALVAALGLRFFFRGADIFGSLRGICIFLLFAVVAAPALGALIGAATVIAHSPSANFWAAWQAWLLANTLTGLTLLPLILVLVKEFRNWVRRATWARVLEWGTLQIGLIGVTVLVFAGSSHGIMPATLFVPLPFLLWAALRFDPGGLIAALSVLMALTIGGAVKGHGPFASESPGGNLIQLQYFLIALYVPLLLLAALIREQRVKNAQLLAVEQELRERDDLLRKVFESVSVRTVVLNRDGVITLASPSWMHLGESSGGLTAGQIGEDYLEVCLHAAEAGMANAREAHNGIRATIEGRMKSFVMEYACHPSGGRAWFRMIVDPMPPTHGGIVVSHIEVTERRLAEESLRETTKRYCAVVEAQTELVCRYLPDCSLTFVNEAYCRSFGRTREQLIGRKFTELIPEDIYQVVAEHVNAAMNAAGRAVMMEREAALADGARHWQQWIDSAILNDAGEVTELQGIGRDITARKQAEDALQRALQEVSRLKERLEAQNAYLQEELLASDYVGEVVCKSPIMRQMLTQVQRVSPTDTLVLILGETGAGKELIARTIHESSRRQHRPFVRLNCASLPATLIESELFGHERGAFTGADSRRLGRFEIANGATLFLDEIGELPLELQAKLLRVLQEGECERLGSSETIKVDVRLIAATNRNLSECVNKGTFRADLYYRLNVFPITVPPLRTRREDIIPLASTFLAEIEEKLGRHFLPMTNEVAQTLLRHEWPGNVRELSNLIERAAISSTGGILQLPDSTDMSTANRGHMKIPEVLDGGSSIGVTLPGSMQEMERKHIVTALDHTHWRIEGPSGAASILGINASTLRFRMKKLGIARTKAK